MIMPPESGPPLVRGCFTEGVLVCVGGAVCLLALGEVARVCVCVGRCWILCRVCLSPSMSRCRFWLCWSALASSSFTLWSSVCRAWLSSSWWLMAACSSCISPLCCLRRLATSLLACSVWLLQLALNCVNSCSSTARLSLRVLMLLYTFGELGVQWAGGGTSRAGALGSGSGSCTLALVCVSLPVV